MIYFSIFGKTELEDWPGENLEGLNERAEVAAFYAATGAK